MRIHQLGRREFITLLGGAAAWPLAARAQQPERMRRIGVLSILTADDPGGGAYLAAFQKGAAAIGWNDGRNMRLDSRPDRHAGHFVLQTQHMA